MVTVKLTKGRQYWFACEVLKAGGGGVDQAPIEEYPAVERAG
jgi:hypothetical protein